MSKKHYVSMAKMMKIRRDSILTIFNDATKRTHMLTVWIKITEGIADVFASDNHRFDRDRFYEACGYTELEESDQ